MTGDELTTLLLRHGVEVMGVDTHDRRQPFTSRSLPEPSYTVHCRDIAAAALSPEMLPSNVELILHSEERPRMNYLGVGRGNFVLTSAPPRTQQLHSDVLRAMHHAPPIPRSQQPTNTPSRRYPTTPTPPRGVDYVDATMISSQLQDLVKVAGLMSASEQSGLVKRVYEN